LLDSLAADAAIDLRKVFQGMHCLADVVDQKPSPTVFDHLAAGAQVHGDNWHAGCISLSQDQTESLWDCVQMQQSAGPREQFVFLRYPYRSDIADFSIIDVRLEPFPIVDFVLDDSSDDQPAAAQASGIDGQMDTFIGVNPAQEDQVLAARFLKRV
jgi:hypothetical protein